ncbi:hypothetical protein EJ08DRAFT_598410 [Tothia fuscella]|uniref:CST complex subunit Ten1 n=1 Tax=Tothia fuscella TaxID=1048955 RepID=A0A9P4NG93_9PEZI|nr:hypothetical protein EJ08DRAFT_598410 [Tothia fuscella]
MAGSIPSILVFLHDIPNLKLGDKVRFLGCVESYDSRSASLFLKHPTTISPVSANLIAKVNLDIVLNDIKGSAIQDGNWVNIVGYVMDCKVSKCVHVQAIMLWEAKGLNLEEYEKIVTERISLKTTD